MSNVQNESKVLKKRKSNDCITEELFKLCMTNSLSSVQRGNLINLVWNLGLDEQKTSFIAEFGKNLLGLDKYFANKYIDVIKEIVLSNDFKDFENLCYLPAIAIYSKVKKGLSKDTISGFIKALKEGNLYIEYLDELEQTFYEILL